MNFGCTLGYSWIHELLNFSTSWATLLESLSSSAVKFAMMMASLCLMFHSFTLYNFGEVSIRKLVLVNQTILWPRPLSTPTTVCYTVVDSPVQCCQVGSRLTTADSLNIRRYFVGIFNELPLKNCIVFRLYDKLCRRLRLRFYHVQMRHVLTYAH